MRGCLRVTAGIGATAAAALAGGCGESTPAQTTSACVRPADPIKVDHLVAVFRKTGISLDANTRVCEGTTLPDATNLGPDGLSEDKAVTEAEGSVLCYLDTSGDDARVRRYEYKGEDHVGLVALNVSCDIFPVGSASEDQINRVERALADLGKS